MCGIVFYCCTQNNLNDQLQESLIKILHRGPDSSDVYYNNIQNYFVGIGHNRLSILDVTEAGSQPMSQNGVILSYNGEIYNHDALRSRLNSKGYEFKGHSDTEVLLLLYIEYGIAAFSMIHGMFAFILLDETQNKIYVVRDKLGIKPIYIYKDETGLYGCSEIRGLKTFSQVKLEISEDDIFEFFNNGFLYEPSTGYTHIKKIMPGHYLEFDLGNGMVTQGRLDHIERYATAGALHEKLEKAINQQIVADVPVGIFFSGGCDSTLIANYLENQNLLFAKYARDNNADVDVEFSKKISDHFNKTLIETTIDDTDNTIEDIMNSVDFVATHSEELISDYTFWSTYQLSLAAKNNGFKVMLSGMGGDEIYAGYPRYLILKRHSLIKLLRPFLKTALILNIFPRKWDKKFERLVSYSLEKHWPTAYSRLLGYFSHGDLKRLFKNSEALTKKYRKKLDEIGKIFANKKLDKVKLAQHFDLFGFLAHNLSVSDKASMLASIELRVPLLDEAIVAHGLALPSSTLLKKGQTKHPLKHLLATLLPKDLVKRPKTGFNPPLDGLIDKLGLQRLQEEYHVLKGFVDVSATSLLLTEHFTGKANNTYKLWQLLYFSRWLRANCNSSHSI